MQRTSGTKGLRMAGLDSATFMALASLTLVGTLIMGASCGGLTGALPASIEALSRVQKLAEKRSQGANHAAPDLGFQQFINSKDSSDPILIGELKPNGSELEMMLLRNKIAGAIMKMQEMEKEKEKEKERVLAAASTQGGSGGGGGGGGQDQGGDCYIEVTKVERVPGKCHRVNNGLPICQSENYMAINSECN